jgi:hypothetical protein
VDFRAWNAAHDTVTAVGAYQYTAGSARRHRGVAYKLGVYAQPVFKTETYR